MWLVSYRDWFSFSGCSLCCYIFLYIRRNVVETVTDGNLMEAICHRCPGGKNISSVGYNPHVRRRHLLYWQNTRRGFVISFLQFIYDLVCYTKYYEWLLVTCKKENKNTDAIEKTETNLWSVAKYTIETDESKRSKV
jgi:hypothetical protein